MRPKRDLQVRRVERFHAAELLDVLGRLLLHDVDDVVDGDDALHPPFGVDHRDRHEVVLREEPADRLLVHVSPTLTTSVRHDVAHRLVRLRGEELLNDTTPRRRCSVVDDVDVVDGLEMRARLLAQVADRLVDGHVRAQPRVARVHQTAGLVLRVREEAGDLLARRSSSSASRLIALLARRLLDQVGDVVGRSETQPRPALVRRKTRMSSAMSRAGKPRKKSSASDFGKS